jgi:hypothetical protein
VATSADRSPPDNPDPQPEEAKSTGTDGRILPFPARVTSEVKTQFTSEVPQPQSNDLFDLSSVKEILSWRPIKFERKKHYPKVVPDGCVWKQDGGGFTLSRQKPTSISAIFGWMRFAVWRRNMAGKRNVQKKIELEGQPKEVVAAVVIAQMHQVHVIANTLSNESDKYLLHTAANVVLELLQGYTTPEVVAAIPQIQAILGERQIDTTRRQ